MVQDVSNTNIPASMLVATQYRQHHVEVPTPCIRQSDRFVDPQGRPLQPGTVIFCDDFLFIVSANGRLYNHTGGNTKQIYIADPREHRFLVKKQSNTRHDLNGDEWVSATPESTTIETASAINNNSTVNNDGDAKKEGNTIHYNTVETITKNEVFLNTRNIADQRDDLLRYSRFPCKSRQKNDTQNSELSPIHTETILRMHHAHNENA